MYKYAHLPVWLSQGRVLMHFPPQQDCATNQVNTKPYGRGKVAYVI